MRRVIVAAVTAPLLGLAACERWELDRQMEELCKKEGGVRVYERVEVPANWLDFAGRPDRRKFPGRAIGSNVSRQEIAGKFIIDESFDTLKGPPNVEPGLVTTGRLTRYRTTVRRVSDGKILGEQVTFGRTGGGISIGHISSSFCPDPRPSPDAVQSVFARQE